jgi:hypothetical protein
VPTARPRSARTTRFGIGCILAYGLLGWVLSGIGAVLPRLRESVGQSADLVALAPGAGLLFFSATGLARARARRVGSAAVLREGAVITVLAMVALVSSGRALTALPVAAILGLASASLIRVLPGAIAGEYADGRIADRERAITRANAWSSIASVAGPTCVGVAIWIGLGWRVGLVAVPVVGLVGLMATLRTGESTLVAGAPTPTVAPGAVVRWLDAWTLLTVGIILEFVFVYFSATFLVEEIGAEASTAALGTASFAVGMAAGRFSSSLIRKWAGPRLSVNLALIALGFAVLQAAPGPGAAIVGVSLAGVGVALLYPVAVGRLLERFPGDADLGSDRAGLASGTALLASPALVGGLRQVTDVGVAFWCVPVLLIVLVVLDAVTVRRGAALAPSEAVT